MDIPSQDLVRSEGAIMFAALLQQVRTESVAVYRSVLSAMHPRANAAGTERHRIRVASAARRPPCACAISS